MTFPKEKESQEPLTQQLRMLQKATYEFIDIKKQDRVSWHSIEYIYSYYTKYLWGRNHEYDFEGEILDYLNRQGEATTRMLLQRLRAEMLKIITFYSKWNEFYDSYTQQDLFKLAYMSSKTDIECYSAGASMHLKDCSEHIKKLEYDGEKLVYSNLQRMLETLSQCHKRYLDSVEEYYDSLTKKIKETEELTSIARKILFDFKLFIYHLQQQVNTINKYIGEPGDMKAYYPADTDEKLESIRNAVEPYFSEEIISSVYRLCNGEQFVQLDFEVFYNAFNLRGTGAEMTIKKQEKQRVYYLIYRLGELLDDVRRSSWTDDFLDTLHLDKNSYGKKYKEVESGDSKSKAKEFAEAVNRIIRKYKS